MQLQVRSATRIRPTGRSRPHADVPTNPAASLAAPPMHVTGRTPARNNSRPAQIHPAPKSKRFPSLALAQLPYPPPPPHTLEKRQTLPPLLSLSQALAYVLLYPPLRLSLPPPLSCSITQCSLYYTTTVLLQLLLRLLVTSGSSSTKAGVVYMLWTASPRCS